MFNLNDYALVEDRIRDFWKEYPDGRIETEVVEFSREHVLIASRIYRTEADPKPWTTGLAQETKQDLGRMSKSYVEICETSSVGRALANAGFAAKGKRPSREEMYKVAAQSEPSRDETRHGGSKLTEPEQFNTVAIIKEKLGAVEIEPQVPDCHHGLMVMREGVSKTGKPYRGYFCTERFKAKQCSPKWMRLVDGSWVYHEAGDQLV